jgi:glycosyltransferase involved in cell wall biosynthesis
MRHPWFLARGLRALHRDPELRHRLRSGASRQIAQFTWEHVAEHIESLAHAHLVRRG